MRRYTIQQRNKIYRKAYELIYKGKERFICYAIVVATNTGPQINFDELDNKIIEGCPEFGLFKPKKLPEENGWYGGFSLNKTNSRLTLLAFLIAMTE